MLVEILVVHPTVTIVQAGPDRQEVPTSWFPVLPKPGQRWELNFKPVKTTADQYALLNQYLSRD